MLCCVCLLDVSSGIDIYDDEGKENNMAEIISKYFWFKVLVEIYNYRSIKLFIFYNHLD